MPGLYRGSRFFEKVADSFIYRLALYAILIIIVGFIAFSAELVLERFNLDLVYHALADGFVSGFALILGLCLFELYLYGRSGWKNQMEAKARNAENMLATVIETIPDLVYIKDVEGRYLLVNKAIEEVSGKSCQELYGKTITDRMPPDLAAACIASDNEAITRREPHRVEEHFANRAGQRIYDTIKSPLFDDRGAVIGIVGISRDITDKIRMEEERRRLQTQLLQAQKMEALGHLAGGVAHDFSNILTVIVGYASVLKTKLAKDELLLNQTEQILVASQKAKTLARGLFAFSSKQQIETQELDLNGLIEGSSKLLTPLVNDRISIRTKCCGTPLTILADQLQLERVLMNLATNAQDAMPYGGDLVLSTEAYEMGDDFVRQYGYGVPGRYALMTVSDTGKGISEENRSKIFEPFFTTKAEGKGTGLGLAIVYGIIKQHNGFITVSSEPARGTTFHAYLPLMKNI